MYSRPRRHAPRFLLCALGAILVCGCQSGYVLKQGLHQLRLSGRKVALAEVPDQVTLSPRAASNLEWIPRIIAFGQEHLGLEPGNSYQTYLDTAGKPISYAVTASLPLALVPYQWRFPFAGRVSYKGFFELEDARKLEGRLRAKGLDTLVTPVHAYSTLGWFRDPVLSTMLEKPLPELVDLLLHECVHQTVYFEDLSSETTPINESLATHVAYEGTLLFLRSHEALQHLLSEYVRLKAREAEINNLLARLRRDLEKLYGSRLSDDEKRAGKTTLFAATSRAYQHMNPKAGAFEFPVSNAFALSHAAYHRHIDAFDRLQESLGGKPNQLMSYLKSLRSDQNPLEALNDD